MITLVLVWRKVIHFVAYIMREQEAALCGSCPLVTSRLGDLLCFVFIVRLLCFLLLMYYIVSLQYFDTVGWVFWPVKTVSHITYTVLEGTYVRSYAKNCRVTWPWPRPLSGKLFVRLLGIPNTKPPTKFEISSSSSFGDIALYAYWGHEFDLSRSRDVIGHVTIR